MLCNRRPSIHTDPEFSQSADLRGELVKELDTKTLKSKYKSSENGLESALEYYKPVDPMNERENAACDTHSIVLLLQK